VFTNPGIVGFPANSLAGTGFPRCRRTHSEAVIPEPETVPDQREAEMQRFGYRNPRYPVDFPVRLTICLSVETVRCRNISVDGMKLQVREPLMPHTRGRVSFEFDEMSFDLCVRVAHCGSSWSGLKFLYESNDQKNAILELIARLSTAAGLVPPLIPKQLVISRRRPFS
jgi:hypothetical protein